MSIRNEFIVIASRFIIVPLSEKIHRKWPSEFKIQIAIVFRFKIETILTFAVVLRHVFVVFLFAFSWRLYLVRFSYKSIQLSCLSFCLAASLCINIVLKMLLMMYVECLSFRICFFYSFSLKVDLFIANWKRMNVFS